MYFNGLADINDVVKLFTEKISYVVDTIAPVKEMSAKYFDY